ncbi:hypothetical protein MMC20_002103 [Loxospora ochrophaea]|nr:hypothetical protein [Loxospora ochrophaea]
MRSPKPIPIRILTHNIRYATTSPFKGEEVWDIRKTRIVNELCFHTAHNPEALICLQEALHQQMYDVLSGLNRDGDEWAYIGVGRDDGVKAGEYSPIFYRPAAWALKAYKTIWLSETPDRPSRGWDAASVRILTVGVFQHHQSRRKIVAMSTHLDDQGSKSRLEAARIIASQASKLSQQYGGKEKIPVFIAGDFNSEPNMEAHEYLTRSFSDIQTLIPVANRYGHGKTFTGFGYEGLPPTRIDFIFLYRESQSSESGEVAPHGAPWAVKGYAVLENRFDDGVYSSDHRAVVGDVLLMP